MEKPLLPTRSDSPSRSPSRISRRRVEQDSYCYYFLNQLQRYKKLFPSIAVVGIFIGLLYLHSRQNIEVGTPDINSINPEFQLPNRFLQFVPPQQKQESKPDQYAAEILHSHVLQENENNNAKGSFISDSDEEERPHVDPNSNQQRVEEQSQNLLKGDQNEVQLKPNSVEQGIGIGIGSQSESGEILELLRKLGTTQISTEAILQPASEILMTSISPQSMPDVSKISCVPKELEYLATDYTANLCTINEWNLKKNPQTQGMVCQYPQLNPFDPVLVQFQGESVSKNLCEMSPEYLNFPQLFATDFQSKLITLIPPSQFGLENCCYKNFSRNHNDDWRTTTSGICIPIDANTTSQNIPPEHEFIKVFCYEKLDSARTSNGQEGKTLSPESDLKFIDMFAFTPLKPSVESRIEEYGLKHEETNVEETLNVAILGLDSISHMNFIRTMPESYEYILEQLKADGLYGYNTIEENTFSNLIPMLFGLHESQFAKAHPKCRISKGPYDECPFLWQQFESSGYRSVYGEDGGFLSMYNYAKEGYRVQPTDYYLRPFIIDSDDIYYWSTKRNEDSFFPCYAGRRLNFQYLLDYMKNTAKTMGKDKRYFELLWGNALSHTHMQWPVKADLPLLETLTWLKTSDFLNNTLLIIMSDHGMRYDGIRDTLQGRIEARSPFAFFVFPEWFQQKYPLAIENFKANKYRLTNPFDFHYTLKDLLRLGSLEDSQIKERSEQVQHYIEENVKNVANEDDKRYGISLFLPIPKSRTCSEIGISDLNCICHQFQPLQDFKGNPVVRRMAIFLVNEINTKLESHTECAKLQLDEIVGAERVVVLSPDLKSDGEINSSEEKDSSVKELTVSIITKPGGASFEARLSINTKTNATALQGGISRTNMYNNQSHCVNVYALKSFCYCMEQV